MTITRTKESRGTLALLIYVTLCYSSLMANQDRPPESGYIDKTGNRVVEIQFDAAGVFSEGRAIAIQNNKCG